MQRILSFEQTPPLSVPLRFFLTAPGFALAAALLLLWQGEAVLASRWSPLTLALTHLLTLGFLAMCMIGALLQILPVVLGIRIPHPRHVAAAAHILLTVGTALLCAAFVTSIAALFQLALPLLLTAFGWLFLAGLRGVWSGAQPSPMLGAIRLALLALAVTVALGTLAATSFGWRVALPLLLITDLHAAWGLIGWVFLLVVGVAYQVVPMFQVTPTYPALLTRWLTGAVFAALVLWAMTMTADSGSALHRGSALFLVGAVLVFALCTLYLLWQRKRAQADPTTLYWRTALLSLLACAALWLLRPVLPAWSDGPAYPLLMGVLFIVGFGVSVISGMLYKIVPFLVWYHLQNLLAGGCAKAPNVRQILPDAVAALQYRFHLTALLLLCAAALWPQWLARPAALAFGAAILLLWRNLWRAARIYRGVLTVLPARAEAAAA